MTGRTRHVGSFPPQILRVTRGGELEFDMAAPAFEFLMGSRQREARLRMGSSVEGRRLERALDMTGGTVRGHRKLSLRMGTGVTVGALGKGGSRTPCRRGVMAFLATHADMGAPQRESRGGVVEIRADVLLPVDIVVAVRALGSEPALVRVVVTAAAFFDATLREEHRLSIGIFSLVALGA